MGVGKERDNPESERVKIDQLAVRLATCFFEISDLKFDTCDMN